MKLAFELVDTVTVGSPVWADLFQSLEGLNRTKGGKRGGICPFFLTHRLIWNTSSLLLLPLNWDFYHELPWFWDLWT